MRKKFLTVLLAAVAALCLCFGLAACGGDKDKSPTADDDLWTAERLYAEAKALGFEGSFDDLVALFKGADGKDGRNGVGIASAKIDENGHLQITLTDGSVLDAGAVSGAPVQNEGTEGLAYRMRRSPTGEETLEVVGIGIAYDLDIVIPATYRDIPVTAIADRAFSERSDLTSISIPDSVTSIGDSAFSGCGGLTSVEIPGGVTSIGRGAFEGCTGLTSIKIPDGVTKIETEVFKGCSKLASISIPDSVIEIGKDAFAGTSYMNTLSANFDSDGVLYLGKILLKAQETISGTYAINPGTKGIAGGAFANCGSLTGVTIPEGVKVIGEGAFSQSGLTGNITIPKSVCKSGFDAFNGVRLTAVNISDLEAWCQIDFTSWESNPLNYAHHLIVDGDEITDLEIPAGVTEVKPYVFCGADFTSVTIGNDVTSIGVGAFEDCKQLQSVVIADSVTEIAGWAFQSCEMLTDLTIGSGVTSIGERAFQYCSKLANLTIPSNVISLGSAVFYGCALESVTFANPNGWSADGMELSSDVLQNEATAAEYLRERYCECIWTRE